MSEVDFDRIVDAVRKEIALAPMKVSLAALRATDERPKTADEERPARRRAVIPMARIRRVGEGQKRYR